MKKTGYIAVTTLSLVFSFLANAKEHTMPLEEMPKYCKGMAAGKFNTKPQYIHIDGPATMTADAGFVVSGKADLGTDGKKHFSCKFDNFGKFLHVQIH